MARAPLSILVIDIGTSETSAFLLDNVDNRYAILAAGHAASTYHAPVYDVWEGCQRAIKQIEKITERILLNTKNAIITPVDGDGDGVVSVVITGSSGPQLDIIAAGLLDDVSVTSCRRLAASIGGNLVDQISLSERSSVEEHLDRAMKHQPQIILLAGGTENGATRAVLKTVDLIHSVCQLLPAGKRPVVLYAGNQKISRRVEKKLEDLTMVLSVANIRPTIDQENLASAQYSLAKIMALIRTQQIAGLENVAQQSQVPFLPTSFTFGRTLRYLSLSNKNSTHPVLGVDIGSEYSVLAEGDHGELHLNVLPYGVGEGIKNTLKTVSIEEILQWMPINLPTAMVRDYLNQKTLYPHTLPITEETLHIEQAFARVLMQLALTKTQTLFDKKINSYDLIAGSGRALSSAPTLHHSLMMLIDGLQPTGVTTMILDKFNLLSAIGAAAAVDPVVPVHAIDSGMLPTLGTVVSPISEERLGKPILIGELTNQNGEKLKFEVNKGEIKVLPLGIGQSGQLKLNGIHRTWVTQKPLSNSAVFKVIGGYCGLVIDGRGRPIELPEDKEVRIDMLRRWQYEIGIQKQVA